MYWKLHDGGLRRVLYNYACHHLAVGKEMKYRHEITDRLLPHQTYTRSKTALLS